MNSTIIPKTDKTDIPIEVWGLNDVLKAMPYEDLQAYVERVFRALEGMEPGDEMNIAEITRPETRDLFIEVVKYYMRSHEWQDGLSFSEGFKQLRKYDIDFITRNSKQTNL